MALKHVMAKLGGMRKAADFIVYPASRTENSEPDTLIIQSDKRICQFNVKTGEGLLSKACPNGAYFIHLTTLLGATAVIVPPDLIKLCQEAQPHSGDVIGQNGNMTVLVA